MSIEFDTTSYQLARGNPRGFGSWEFDVECENAEQKFDLLWGNLPHNTSVSETHEHEILRIWIHSEYADAKKTLVRILRPIFPSGTRVCVRP